MVKSLPPGEYDGEIKEISHNEKGEIIITYEIEKNNYYHSFTKRSFSHFRNFFKLNNVKMKDN